MVYMDRAGRGELGKKHPKAQQSARSHCEAKLRALGYRPSGKEGQPENGAGEGANYQDLCQQIRMAEAAERATEAAEAQLNIAWLSLIFLVAATGATGAAALYAVKTYRAERRGHLAVASFIFNRNVWKGPDGLNVSGFRIRIEIKNSGQAPVLAALPVISTRTTDDGSAKIDWRFDEPARPKGVYLSPEQEIGAGEVLINLHSARLVFQSKLRIFYMVRNNYSDVFELGGDFHTYQCFELKVWVNPDHLFGTPEISLADSITLEGIGEYGSAS